MLVAFFAPLLVLGAVAYTYRRIFPKSLIEEQLNLIGEYKALERRGRGKRAVKKLRSLEPRYKRARRILLFSNLFKFMMVILAYMATSLYIVVSVPPEPAPAYIPVLTVETTEGLVVNPLTVHFMGYMYAIIVFREAFL